MHRDTRPAGDRAHPEDELARIAGAETLPAAFEHAVTIAARATGGRRCLVMSERGVGFERGFAPAVPPLRELVSAIRAGDERASLPGLGEQAILAAALPTTPPGWLVVCRGGDRFGADERERLAAVAVALGGALARLGRDDERG